MTRHAMDQVKGIGNWITIPVLQEFIDQRDARAEKYNPRGRTLDKLKMDIECEIFEWWMIHEGKWDDSDRWEIDGVCPVYGNVDVKFVKKWYNLTCQKLIYLLRQRDITEHFLFCEWKYRPSHNGEDRLLVDGDTVQVSILGALEYWDLINNLKTSKYNGFYADVKTLLKMDEAESNDD